MNIVIAGGGDVGVKIAKKLIYENHNVTIIERDSRLIKGLQSRLDAMIIKGDATSISTLLEANVFNADSFIAVTNNDTDNIISCKMCRKICKEKTSITCKVDSYNQYFDGEHITHEDFGIDKIIKPTEITALKITELLKDPNIFEVVDYADNTAKLVGVKVSRNFPLKEIPLAELGNHDELFHKVRVVAIQRDARLIVPKGFDFIHSKDKLYIVGKTEIIKILIDKYFSTSTHLDNFIIVGGTKYAIELAKVLGTHGKNLTIIEEDVARCKQLSTQLDDVMIVNGIATDSNLMEELNFKNSCVITMSDNDEYNILSAFTAKKYCAPKTMCMIKNSSIVTLISNLDPIDVVFSPHSLTIGEILKATRKTDLFSVSAFTEIDAETIGINVTKKLKILDIPIKNLEFPKKSIVGLIIRDGEVIIPTGNDMIKIGDKIIVFLLPESISAVEKIFSPSKFGGFR